MIFGFGRKKSAIATDDREHLRLEDEKDLGFILRERHLENRIVLAVSLANDWRLFLDSFGSATEFEQMPRAPQQSYLQHLLTFSAKARDDANQVEGAPNPESMELLCESLTARFLASFSYGGGCQAAHGFQSPAKVTPRAVGNVH